MVKTTHYLQICNNCFYAFLITHYAIPFKTHHPFISTAPNILHGHFQKTKIDVILKLHLNN
ncbi:hypothetical protein Hanom_Chr02g00101511 [Helianthus anomalus]